VRATPIFTSSVSGRIRRSTLEVALHALYTMGRSSVSLGGTVERRTWDATFPPETTKTYARGTGRTSALEAKSGGVATDLPWRLERRRK
jgi:hypothetical protein